MDKEQVKQIVQMFINSLPDFILLIGNYLPPQEVTSGKVTVRIDPKGSNIFLTTDKGMQELNTLTSAEVEQVVLELSSVATRLMQSTAFNKLVNTSPDARFVSIIFGMLNISSILMQYIQSVSKPI